MYFFNLNFIFMDVLVERFLRRKDVTNPDSQKLYYLRQKPKTCGTVDIDVLAAVFRKIAP